MYPPNRGPNKIRDRHGGASQAAVEDNIESQNDAMMGHLQSKITSLKSVSQPVQNVFVCSFPELPLHMPPVLQICALISALFLNCPDHHRDWGRGAGAEQGAGPDAEQHGKHGQSPGGDFESHGGMCFAFLSDLQNSSSRLAKHARIVFSRGYLVESSCKTVQYSCPSANEAVSAFQGRKAQLIF